MENNSKAKWMRVVVAMLVLAISLPGNLWAGKLGKKGETSGLAFPEIKLETFGKIGPVKEFKGQAKLKDSATTVDKAINLQQVQTFLEVPFSKAQIDFLNTHKFLLIPKSETRFKKEVSFAGAMGSSWDEMLGLFDEISGASAIEERAPQDTHLISPAVVLHAFHKFFENTLEYIEKNDLSEALKDFLKDMQALAIEGKNKGGVLADHYELLAAQMTVPLILIENADWRSLQEQQPYDTKENAVKSFADDKDGIENALKLLESWKNTFSQSIQEKMKTELKFIYGAREVAVSPLFGGYSKNGDIKSDYTQFTPRSHYAKSSALRAYFRTMMFLGRNGYFFETDQGITDACLAACLMATPGAAGKTSLENWQRIMDVTGFFAGFSDDISYPQLSAYLIKVLGKNEFSPDMFVDSGTLKKIVDGLQDLASPKIFSEILVTPDIGTMTKDDLLKRSKSFRIFGQRFTFDGWVMGRLSGGQEKKDLRLPTTPSAVFVAAIFGSDLAKTLVGKLLKREEPPFSEEEVAKFEKLMGGIIADIAKVKDEEWFAALSPAWLKVLGTMTRSFGEGYPLYMQSKLFSLRQLEDFLGSFAELKHDTLLYSKPEYAEMGEGAEGEIPPVPKGFVEPNLAFWYELQRLIDYTIPGLMKLKVKASEKEEFGGINEFKRQVAFFTSLAEKELAGEKISDDEYEELRLTKISYMAAPYETLTYTDEDRRSALIADLHTDVEKGTILYEATGEPNIMIALVGNENTPRLTIGVVFNHYEFSRPLGTRESDQTWQEQVYRNPEKLPQKNFWYQDVLVK